VKKQESPAIRVIEKMLEIGADVKFYDPWVKSFKEGSLKMNSEKQLTTELVESTDIVIITAAHTNVDYSFVQKHAKVIFDTKNVMKNITNKDNIELL
jgi:UDP-N-acetyl-D-glucosamine dehydrogenase